MNDYKNLIEKYEKNKIDIDLTDIIKLNIFKLLSSIIKDFEFLGELSSKIFIEEIFKSIQDTKINNINELVDLENIINNMEVNNEFGRNKKRTFRTDKRD